MEGMIEMCDGEKCNTASESSEYYIQCDTEIWGPDGLVATGFTPAFAEAICRILNWYVEHVAEYGLFGCISTEAQVRTNAFDIKTLQLRMMTLEDMLGKKIPPKDCD